MGNGRNLVVEEIIVATRLRELFHGGWQVLGPKCAVRVGDRDVLWTVEGVL